MSEAKIKTLQHSYDQYQYQSWKDEIFEKISSFGNLDLYYTSDTSKGKPRLKELPFPTKTKILEDHMKFIENLQNEAVELQKRHERAIAKEIYPKFLKYSTKIVVDLITENGERKLSNIESPLDI
ncbi:hypothetical protein HK100_011011, partial [Physocladia obscura]